MIVINISYGTNISQNSSNLINENDINELKFNLSYFLKSLTTDVIIKMILLNGCCTEKELSDQFQFTRSAITIRLKSMNQFIVITDPSLKVKKIFGSPVCVVISLLLPKHYNNGQNSKLLLND